MGSRSDLEEAADGAARLDDNGGRHSTSQTSSQAVRCSRGQRCSPWVSFVVMLATRRRGLIDKHARSSGDWSVWLPRTLYQVTLFP